MDDLEKFTRFAQKLTEAIASELEDTARMDERMDSATRSALHSVAHVVAHGIDHEFIARAALDKDFD